MSGAGLTLWFNMALSLNPCSVYHVTITNGFWAFICGSPVVHLEKAVLSFSGKRILIMKYSMQYFRFSTKITDTLLNYGILSVPSEV